jgi:lysophospholipase L1-like esterase
MPATFRRRTILAALLALAFTLACNGANADPRTHAEDAAATASVAPGTIAPGTIAPGTIAPDTVAPGTVAAATTVPPSAAQDTKGDTRSRWETAFAAFATADHAAPPPPGGVLFVGSSSIRLWQDLEQQFSTQPVVLKRGFGGSRLSDCVANLNRLVIAYRPRLVLLYAGDNDIASGSAPAEVLRRFAAFVDGVRAALPATRIAYISIKPCPARATLLPRIREANTLIHDYIEAHAGLAYIDVHTPMLDASGEPRPDLFRGDRLHLNAAGYALWQRIIEPYVVAAR